MKGEEVRVLPEPLPTSQPAAPKVVDWAKSAACLRDRTGEPLLSKEDVAELFEAMRGEY